jgi:F-type H+-transporting ATPase subunit delta
MRKAAIARRFAKALLELDPKEEAAERHLEELGKLATIFSDNPILYTELYTPMHTVAVRTGLMGKVCGAAEVSPAVAGFMKVLVQTRSIKLLDEIVGAYSRLLDVVAGRLRATVEAPGELTGEVLSEIKSKLDAMTGKDVVVTKVINEELIGGLVIRVENTIMDGSLNTQLDLLKEKILEGVA